MAVEFDDAQSPGGSGDPAGGPGVVRTDGEVLDGAAVLVVVHRGDGCWQLCSRVDAVTGTAAGSLVAAVASWTELVAADPTLEQVGSLPPGWVARRDTPSSLWRRSPG